MLALIKLHERHTALLEVKHFDKLVDVAHQSTELIMSKVTLKQILKHPAILKLVYFYEKKLTFLR
jgi:hypothetical protein